MSEKISRANVLRLYRQIIKAAKIFPSIKKLKILAEIRFEFRQNRSITNEEEIRKYRDKAIKGLEQLSMYSDLPKNAFNWKVDLEKEPMPQRKS